MASSEENQCEENAYQSPIYKDPLILVGPEARRNSKLHSFVEQADNHSNEARNKTRVKVLPTTAPKPNLKPPGARNIAIQNAGGNSDSVFTKEEPLVNLRKKLVTLLDFPWFHNIERHAAEELMLRFREQGMFLVRKSSRGGFECPFSLTLYFGERVFHLNVRRMPDGRYALGKEKPDEVTFASLPELVINCQLQPVTLKDSRGNLAGECQLNRAPPKATDDRLSKFCSGNF